MTLEQVALFAQIAGVAVVTVTLIYLAVQVRQGAQQLRSEVRQTQLENDQTGVYKFVEHPELAAAFSQAETPTFEEKTRLLFWMIGQMRAREYEWLQYQAGVMSKESWETYRGVILFVLGTPRSRDLWALCREYFNPAFAASVDAMVENAPTIELWDRLQSVK